MNLRLFFNKKLVFALLTIAGIVFVQAQSITGQVLDDFDFPVEGVLIQEEGNESNSTTTDIEGYFEITVNPGANIVLSGDGYANQTVAVGNSTNLTVRMEELISLDETVVVAYGSATKESLTGSVAVIDAEQIENRPIADISSAFEGLIPGVQFTSTDGQPGGGQSFFIRGFTSLNSSLSPLIVIDGIIGADMDALNPLDVESVSVLKDAASTALYGARAANGVVLITTKRGKNRRDQFNLTVSQGFVTRGVPEYDFVDDRTYMELVWESLRNGQVSNGSTAADAAQFASNNLIDVLAHNPYLGIANDQVVGVDGRINPNASLTNPSNYDWVDALERTGSRQIYNFGYSGGSETTSYNASLGYTKDVGYILNSDFERYQGSLTMDTNPRDWLTMGMRASVTFSRQKEAADQGNTSFVNPFRTVRNIGPIYPIELTDADGNFVLDENGNTQFDLTTPRGPNASNGRHPIAETLWNNDINNRTIFQGGVYVDFAFLKYFNARSNLGYQNRNFNNSAFENPIVGDGEGSGRLTKVNSRTAEYTLTNTLNFNKDFFGDLNVDLLLGQEHNDFEFSFLDGFKTNQIFDGIQEFANFTELVRADSETSRGTFESYFGRLNINWDEKYFISGSLRRDETSRFPVNVRSDWFYSVGGSWLVSKENFLQNASWLNYLKLKASYGETANAGDELFPFQGLYTLGLNNATVAGVIQESLQNNDLTWETTADTNFGVEFAFFNRIRGSVEWYMRDSKSLIFDFPLPDSSGFSELTINAADISNDGVEIQVTVDAIKSKDFQWDLTFIANQVNNTINDLGGAEEEIVGTKRWAPGRSRFDFWLREYYGVDPSDGVGLYRAQEAFDDSGALRDDVRIIDQDTLTTNVSNGRFHYNGSSIPDLFGSVLTNIRYKNFSLFANFTYGIGGKIYDSTFQSLLSTQPEGGNLHPDMLNRWQQPGDITSIPRLDTSLAADSFSTSDQFLIGADYFALRTLQLSYSFNDFLKDYLNIRSLRVFVSGENLWLSSKRRGLDPQVSLAGVTDNSFSAPRIISAGINVTF